MIGEIILLESNNQTSDTDVAENLDRRKMKVLMNLSEGLKCFETSLHKPALNRPKILASTYRQQKCTWTKCEKVITEQTYR